MTSDQQYNIGKKNPFQIDFGKLKSGIKAEEFKDNAAMLEIFNASDSNKNSVLEDNEVSVFVDKLTQAAGEDKTLDESETKAMLKQEAEAQRQAGEKASKTKVKGKDVFSFLNKWQSLSEKSTIKSSTVQGDKRVVLYEDGAQEVINRDGSKILTTVAGNIKSVKSFASNGKLEKEERTDEETGIVETLLYDEDGNVTEHKRTGKTADDKTVTQILDDNGRPLKEIINEGQEDETLSEFSYTNDNSYVKTTTSGNAKSTIVVKDGEVSTIEAAQYKNGIKVQSYSKDEEGNQTVTFYNDNGQKVFDEVTSEDGSLTRTVYNPENGRKLAAELHKGDEVFVAKYDGKGNTIVVVQNGETFDKICQDFDRTPSELAASNKGNLHKNAHGKYYFTAGQEVKIAGELPPDYEGLQGRTSSEEARAEYKQQVYQRTAQKLQGKELKEITFRKNYSSLSEYAVDLLRSEGVSKPTNKQIADKTNELVVINGNIVPKKGQKIRAPKTDYEIRQDQEQRKAQVASGTKESVISTMNAKYNAAQESFNYQMDKDGWAADFADSFAHIWNNDLWETTGNTASMVRRDLAAYKNQITELDAARKNGNFETKFRETFGVEYSQEKVQNYNQKREKYVEVASLAAALRTLSACENEIDIGYEREAQRRVDLGSTEGAMHYPDGTPFTKAGEIESYDETATKKRYLEDLLNLEKGALKDVEASEINTMFSDLKSKLKAQYEKASGGKSLNDYQKEMQDAYTKAYGTENDIVARVEQYNMSQDAGASAVKSVAKVAGAIVVTVLSAGTGSPALVAALGAAGVSFAVDASDMASNNVYNSTEEYLVAARDAAIDGASQYFGGQATQIIKGAGFSTPVRYALTTATETGFDAAAEYLKTGEVTMQNVLMSAAGSLAGQFIGDAIEARQQRKADNAVAAQWSEMSPEQQWAQVENDPRWRKAIQSDVDPMHNNDLLPSNWSQMTDEQKRAFNQQRQLASQAWKARTTYADIDPMLRPVPREFEFPENFDSLTKEEQKAFRAKRNKFLAQRQQDHAAWLLEHNGVEADVRTNLTTDAHHRYVQDYSAEELGRTGTQLPGANGSTVSIDGQPITVASGERVEISYGQYVDARVDGEMFRSSGLNQDITDLNVRLYGHGSANAAALSGVDVNSRGALSRTPKAIEMGVSQDDKLIDVAHDLATNAYSGRVLPADSGLELIDEITDSTTGLHAKAYKQDGKVFITYSGSSDQLDFRVDHQMIDGNLPDQYAGAIAFKDKIKQQFPDADIIVTGHSLGGSLSELVASSDADVLSITFDAVGTKNIVQNNGLSDYGNSCNIIVNGDNISNAYEHVGYTTRMDGNGVAGTVTRPDGDVVTVRTNSAHALDATDNASQLISAREAVLDSKIMKDAPFVADASGRSYVPSAKVVEVTTAEATNDWWKKQGYTEPPYLPGTEVQIIELTEPTTFVRVMDGDNSGVFGGWVMRAEDLLKPDGTPLSPLEIQQKFALKTTPTHVVDVTLPEGTQIRMGEVNPLEAWGKKGGGTQFDLMGQRVGEFDNARRIEDLKIKKK